MANIKSEAARAELRSKVLHAAARMFLHMGYSQSTTRGIASQAGVNVSAMNREFGCKENILCDLVEYVLENQFELTAQYIRDYTDDRILFYAAETTLQLYLAESDENIRELYSVAYTLPGPASLIQKMITGKLQLIFGEHLPDLSEQDFFELELASGGIMRSLMAHPCNEQFPIERKVARFIECSFRLYQVPEEKIREAITFVGQFDYPTMARQATKLMLERLDAVGGETFRLHGMHPSHETH